MSQKRNIGRFCIQFNPNDSRHLQVIEFLESQGRRKAHFIAEAILNYLGDSTEAPVINPALLKSIVSAMVNDIFQKESTMSDSSNDFDLIETSHGNEELLRSDPELYSAIRDAIVSTRSE